MFDVFVCSLFVWRLWCASRPGPQPCSCLPSALPFPSGTLLAKSLGPYVKKQDIVEHAHITTFLVVVPKSVHSLCLMFVCALVCVFSLAVRAFLSGLCGFLTFCCRFLRLCLCFGCVCAPRMRVRAVSQF